MLFRSEDLGFEYLCANNKDEYLDNLEKYISPEMGERSIVFEVFTNSCDESNALEMIDNIEISIPGVTKQIIKDAFGKSGISKIKKIVKKS